MIASSPSWRLTRRLCLATAALGVAAALFYGIENWRGHRAWSAERAALAQSNTPIEPAQLIPPQVPDDQNLASAPPFDRLFEKERDPDTGQPQLKDIHDATAWCNLEGINGAPNYPGVGPTWTGYGSGTNLSARPLDLAKMAEYLRSPAQLRKDHVRRARTRYVLPTTNAHPDQPMPTGFPIPATPGVPAQDVLHALSLFDADMAALAALARRPHSRFPVRYEDGFSALLPHLALIKGFTGVFTLRAVARLETGQSEGALGDVRTALLLAESSKDEPLVISQLVRYATVTTALQPLWEGITRHRWSEAQLEAMQGWFAATDLLPGIRLALAGERVLGAEAVVKTILASPQGRRDMAGMLDEFQIAPGVTTDGMGFGSTYLFWAPRGWLYASLAEISRALRSLETARPADLPQLADQWPPAPPSDSPRYLLYRAYLRGTGDSSLVDPVLKGYRAQAHLRLAQTACALERHRLQTGSYPEQLDSLAPRWLASLPLDPMDGKPLRYTREAPDRFRLWSIGANHQDDDGQLVVDANAPARLRNLDWVWTWAQSNP